MYACGALDETKDAPERTSQCAFLAEVSRRNVTNEFTRRRYVTVGPNYARRSIYLFIFCSYNYLQYVSRVLALPTARTSLGTWKVIRTDTISYSILETHQKRHPSSYLRNLGGFICRDGCRACLSNAYSYALSLYVRSRSCSVDIGVSITIIRDWVHYMCIISQYFTQKIQTRN